MIGKETRGGARPGSGRKSVMPGNKRVQTSISVSQETWAKIKILAKHNIRIGRIIDNIVNDLYTQHCNNEEVGNI